jgi:hypothetical protein
VKVGDIFYALHALGDEFQAEVVKQGEIAGDKAGATLGQRMTKAVTGVLRVGLAGVAAAAAIATGGMKELDDTVAEFTTDTGASADEADRARKAILEMSSRNIQPMREIGKTLGVVRTDLGLVGDEAESTTELFLRFARVTKRDASEEVKSFDDILDAWGLTAKDAKGIMDKLIESHDRYGGSIAENEAALAAMAPQLKALNLTVDDGIGLLNLFASSGLDAAAGQKALNTAITNLPDGESLQHFLARLSQVEDDGERAQLAMSVFGAKAGAGLANAIRPGIASIDQFKISADEAAGATDRAAEAADSAWGTQIQLKLKAFSAKLIEVGQGFGPLITGAASAGTFITSIFGPAAVSRLVKGAVSAGKAAGAAVGDGMEAVWQGAQGTVIGNFIASRIEKVLESNLVQVALQRSGLNSGAVFAKFMFAGEVIAGLAARGLAAIGGSPGVVTAVSFSGAKLGAIFQVAFLAGIAALVLVGGGQIINALGIHDVDGSKPYYTAGKNRGAAFGGGFVEGARVAAGNGDLLAATIRDDWATEIGHAATDLGRAMEDPIAAATARVDELAKNLDLSDVRDEFTTTGDVIKRYADEQVANLRKAIADQLDYTSKSLSDLVAYQSGVETATSGVYSALNDATVTKNRIVILEGELSDARKEQKDKGSKITAAEIADYENRRIAIEGEMADLKLHLILIGDDLHRESALEAMLTSADLKTNLTSENDNIRTAAEVQRDKILGYLIDIRDKGGPSARDAALIVAQWLDPSNPLSPMFGVSAWGGATGSSWVDSLNAKLRSGYADTEGILKVYAAGFAATSPPGPKSPLHFIDRWGRRTGEAWTAPFIEALRQGVGRVRAVLSDVGGALQSPVAMRPAFASPLAGLRPPDVGLSRAMSVANDHAAFGLATAQAAADGGGLQIHMPFKGLLPAERVEDVIRPLRQLAQTGQLGSGKRILFGEEPVVG